MRVRRHARQRRHGLLELVMEGGDARHAADRIGAEVVAADEHGEVVGIDRVEGQHLGVEVDHLRATDRAVVGSPADVGPQAQEAQVVAVDARARTGGPRVLRRVGSEGTGRAGGLGDRVADRGDGSRHRRTCCRSSGRRSSDEEAQGEEGGETKAPGSGGHRTRLPTRIGCGDATPR